MKRDHFTIAQWIASSLAEDLTEEESRLLEEWRHESAENERLYLKIKDQENRRRRQEQLLAFDKEEGWRCYEEKRVRRAGRNRSLRRYLRYAAAAAVLISAGVYWGVNSPAPSLPTPLAVITPGTTKAKLVLSDGKELDLEQVTGEIKTGEGEAVVYNSKNLLSYQSAEEKESKEPEFNEMRVPKGGEYQLKLSDGTLVYLNSETTIRYPVSFSGKTREVELTGEAYFEVSPDAEKPFIVNTDFYGIRVLGTRFNVSSYAGGGKVHTTLVEGAVAITGIVPGEEIRLKPNEQFSYDPVSREAAVNTVDVSYSTAWKDGKFRFRDERLEEIMRMIERWYDVEIKYVDEEVKEFRFGFNLERDETIDRLLRIFEQNGKIMIQTSGKVLKIRRGR